MHNRRNFIAALVVFSVGLSSCSNQDSGNASRKETSSESKSNSFGSANPKSVIKKPKIKFEINAEASAKEPQGFMFFGGLSEQRPIFVTLKIQKQEIIDATRYGRFQITSIKDDSGNSLKLLQPLEGDMKEDLTREMDDINHFFLESPSILRVVLVVEKPKNAKTISVEGSFELEVRNVITIENILSKLGNQLSDPELHSIGEFTASIPPQDESDTKGSLAIDFVGTGDKFDEFEILRRDGYIISTGGIGTRTPDGSRMIRWSGGDLPNDAMLRIVVNEDLNTENVPFDVSGISVDQSNDGN